MILGMFARLFWPCFSELHRSERKACCRATAPRPESGLGFKFCSKHNSEPELQKGFFFSFFFLQTGQMDKSKNWEALHFRLRFLMLLNKTTTFFTSTSTDVVVLYYLGKNTFMIRCMDPLAPVTETLRNTCNTQGNKVNLENNQWMEATSRSEL